VRRRIVDLFAFRDDVHISAWRSHEEFGHLWETFTYVWNDEANTPSELAERLHFRGFNETDYYSALRELVGRGWLTEVGGIYKAIPAGRALREAVEAQTNSFFDSPWMVLSETEYEEVQLLMNNLAQAVECEKEYL
jgi:hypothetical protein